MISTSQVLETYLPIFFLIALQCRQACYEQYILPCTMPGVPQEDVSQIAVLDPE